MKNTISAQLVLGLLGTLVLSACGDYKGIAEHRRVRQAPMNQEATGVIVSGASEADVQKALDTKAELKVRVVNPKHGLYEVYGDSLANVRALFPNYVTVEKNQFVDLRDKTFKTTPLTLEKLDGSGIRDLIEKMKPRPATQRIQNLKKPKRGKNTFSDQKPGAVGIEHPFVVAIKNSQQVELTGELKAFVESCKLSNFQAPEIQVMSNIAVAKEENGLVMDVGQTITLDAANSVAKVEPSTLEFLWVLTAPSDSEAIPRASRKAAVTTSPDTTGLHIFSAVVKNSAGFCDMVMSGYYVTANTPYTPGPSFDDSAANTLDKSTFWHIFHIGANTAWKQSLGNDMIVGIIDSGVDYNHPALTRNVLVNKGEIAGNGIDDDNNGFVDDVVGYDFGLDDPHPYDDYGHGTHVAGIAASNIIGAARKAKILTTKFGAGFGFDVASVAGAIKYSVDSGAKVLNMSFGWEEDFAVIKEAMLYARDKNVLVVAASGNDGVSNDRVNSYPCNYSFDNVISIASSDENDALVFYSNFGKKVHLAAPGGSPEKMIYSASKSNPKKTQFVGMMGTSMASPLVAGVAAQVWSVNPSLTAVQVREILLTTGRESAALKSLSVPRVVNAEAAVAKAAQAKFLPLMAAGL